MNKNVIVIGAGGHGKVIADIIVANKDHFIGYLDDDLTKSVLGAINDYSKYDNCEFVIGIGNNETRKKISSLPIKWYSAIHPSAVISPSAIIGEGTVVMPNAVINADAVIGKHCIINTGAIIEHDDAINDYAHISVGAKLGGTVTIGRQSMIGIGATVKNNITIQENAIIGAGAVVVKNVEKSGTYIGVPAKLLNK